MVKNETPLVWGETLILFICKLAPTSPAIQNTEDHEEGLKREFTFFVFSPNSRVMFSSVYIYMYMYTFGALTRDNNF